MYDTLLSQQQASGPTSFPLQGKGILVTRASKQAGALSSRLRKLGAIPVEFPTIQIAPPEDWAPLDAALIQLCARRSPIDRGTLMMNVPTPNHDCHAERSEASLCP